jgi:hypothetical protein
VTDILASADWVELSRRILAEADLTFDDVVDIGRPWILGRPPFEAYVSRPAYAGECRYANPENPTSRKKTIISLTGPVDCAAMFCILAHEVGHALDKRVHTSDPDYVKEYRAETFAWAKFEEYLGVPVPVSIQHAGRRYVRSHCEARYRDLGKDPTKGWDKEILEWCKFKRRVVSR